MNHILLVDDDPEIRQLLTTYLSKNSFEVTAYADAESLLASDLSADCLILDIGLPGMDGLAACREVRNRSALPIIMLTAASDDVDRILGLELGADDYMGKPFNPRELLARIRALLRRVAPATPANNGLSLLPNQRAVQFKQQVLELTGSEYSALEALLEGSPEVVTRDTLSYALHGRPASPLDRTVDTAVSRLRQKLTGIGAGDSIRNVRGKGYVLVQPETLSS